MRSLDLRQSGQDRWRPCSFASLLLVTGIHLLAAAGSLAQTETSAQPKKKDSPAFLAPKEVNLSSSVTPAEAKPGEMVTFRVAANIASPWHIYAYSKEQPDEGPRATQFDLFQNGGLEPQGDWTPDKPALEKPEAAFDNKVYGSYEGEASWSLRLKVPDNVEPGVRSLKAQAYFQICDPKSCRPPAYVTAPAAELTILAGSGAPAKAPPPSDTAAATNPPLKEGTSTGAEVELPLPEGDASSTAVLPEAQPVVTSAVESKIQEGLIPFLLFSALGGLAALVMPCVWPMVPVTVNFFVKQGQLKQGNTTRLAVSYCLAIIAIFTLVGVLFSAFVGAASLQRLANTAWLNLTVAAIFLIFGLSLLGLFELRLPSFLLNASARGEGKGGFLGIFFMALTLTITSFTCTFPVVGGLLVVAAGGSYLYPILGLATFATVLALPFFLLALAPGLIQRVPRSGDWMNTVKIVGGLVEIGAALKFLNTAEIALGATPESAWFDAQFVLSAWVMLSVIAGLYLLGIFRTDHDHDEVKVGPIRLLFACVFVFFALYMSPALFGYPPESRLYNLFVGLLPADVGELGRPAYSSSAEGAEVIADIRASSPDPKVATRQEQKHHGVLWGMNMEQALEVAREQNRPVLVDFTGVNCANCRQMEREVLPKPEIRELLKQFVTVALYTDFVPIGSIPQEERENLARENQERQYQLVRDVTTPLYVVLTPQNRVVASRGGYIPAGEYRKFLEKALEEWREN